MAELNAKLKPTVVLAARLNAKKKPVVVEDERDERDGRQRHRRQRDGRNATAEAESEEDAKVTEEMKDDAPRSRYVISHLLPDFFSFCCFLCLCIFIASKVARKCLTGSLPLGHGYGHGSYDGENSGSRHRRDARS